MALEKITNAEIQAAHVQAAPDTLTGTAAQNKSVFDALPELICEKYNDIVTKLTSSEDGSSGADQIAVTAITGLVGTTVQAILESLKEALNGQATDIGSCIVDWVMDYDTGDVTVTKFDGTEVVYQTELEKVITNMTYDAETQSLILTYPDGTTSSVSLADFVAEYDFEDSETIVWSVSGHKVRATLSPTYYNALQQAKADAEAAALNAQTYAGNASSSATAAAGSATAADTSATLAASYATNAGLSASAADTSASNAASSEANAASSASSASTYASDAESSASAATGSATTAGAYATEAGASATAAAASETAAAGSASDASDSATAAAGSASDASDSATAAAGSASSASDSATSASGSAASAAADKLVSEGWAKGTQNGTEVGSESPYYHNNSKWFKDQAESIVGPSQPKITATGILKGEGDGVVSAASASDIPTDSAHRFVTDNEKSTWNNKSDFSGSYADLTNKPTIPSALSDLSEDTTHRVVTDTEKSTWNNKSDFSGSYADLSNKPIIPSALSDLSDDSTHRLVTDAEKSAWNNKADPASIPTALSDLSADSTHRLVTDTEKATWNAKQGALTAGDNITITGNVISAAGFSPQIKAAAPAGAVVVATKGGTTKTATADAEGYAYLDVSEYGTWTVSCAQTGKTESVAVTEVKQYEVNVSFFKYGFRIKKSESDPNTRVEYLFDCANFTPATMNMSTHELDYGSWEDFVNEICRPVMLKYDGTVDYELDHTDQTKKLDGTSSDITSTAYAGNAMVEFKKLYTRMYEEDDYQYVIISDSKLDANYKALGFENSTGEADVAYWGMYEGSNVSSRLRSIAGQGAMVSQTATTEEDYAKSNNTAGGLSPNANGDGWYVCYKALWDHINNLLILISKSTDNQASFGYGRCKSNNSSGTTPGSLKAYGAFWGSNDQTSCVKTFYIEDFWGNYWNRIAGFILNGSSGIYTKMKPPYATPSTSASAYTSYTATGVKPGGTSGTAVSEAVRGENGYLPKTASGSDTTYECDAYWFATNQVDFAFVGGNWNNALRDGGRSVYLGDLASYTYARICARLSFIPL